ncbi:membrane protein of unknown function [Nitrospira japonica]|uniref:Uncharacterized protein n=1 Tax=Nitrospira japonica TaxID=1325564 RepID=A0A1W1I838_9BACT|nr:hypothetical protein [Nitrospira japonica]SLM48973.1 membrane protein of unknown function [Nitrospira japonica]
MAHRQAAHSEYPDSIPFSLFEGDFLTRFFQRIGMGSYRTGDLVKRALFLMTLTWGVLAALAVWSGLHWTQPRGQNFFFDFAAYGQLIAGLPMFLVAERVIDRQTKEVARCFVTTGVVEPGDAIRLVRVNWQLKQSRHKAWPDLLCILLGYAITAAWMIPEMNNGRLTWHATDLDSHLQPMTWYGFREMLQTLTWPGAWEFIFVGPLTTYWWLRWSVKVLLWTWYLYQVSNLRLNLVPSHPDSTGGIGFLSDAQTKFGWIILAYGISYVAPTILYKLTFEGATILVLSVWGYAASFVIGAPVLFTLPLFMFTQQLSQAKSRALEVLQERSMERAQAFEEKWLKACTSGHYELMSGSDLTGLDALNRVYDHIHKMRVVPFDLRSFSELVGSALGPMVPLLPYIVDIPEPFLKAIEEGKKLLH